MTLADLRSSIGQLFISGYDTNKPSTEFLDFYNEAGLGGIILFSEQCESPGSVIENINIIKSQSLSGRSSDLAPLIAIDQEGGRVCRLKTAPAVFGAAADYGHNHQLEQFQEVFRRSAFYLESLGINLTMGPVADIWLNDNNECLRGRCFGSDPGTVSIFVNMAINVARDCGLLTCLKHFPGLGAAEIDPHLSTAEADYSQEEWQRRERIPFEDGLKQGADLVMTTHLKLPNIDDTIVTGSKKIIETMLRGRLGFDGPVITDDLTMNGADALGDIKERTLKAFLAGHDLLLFGRDYISARTAWLGMLEAFDGGLIDSEQLTNTFQRVAALRYKLGQQIRPSHDPV